VWLFGGSKTNVKWVEGGRTATRRCEQCGETSTFREGDVTDKVHLFFVELLETSQRRMVCTRCGDDHAVDDFFAKERVVGPAKRPDPPARAAGKADPDVDEMLAALKRKIGK
jgi:hypothetical protein